MFAWLFDKDKKKFEPINVPEKKPEPVEAPVVEELSPLYAKALAGKCISERQIFEDFILKTYKAHIKSLCKYPVRCSVLGITTREVLRIGSDGDTVVFLHEETGEFYYLRFRELDLRDSQGDLVIQDREFSIETNYVEVLEDYLAVIDTEDEILLAVRELLIDHKG